jgi:hypothetical protein
VSAGLALDAYEFLTSVFVFGDDLFLGSEYSYTYPDQPSDCSGIWRRPLAEMVTSAENHKEQLPTEFALEQNYPNPFNPTTTIAYTLPHRSDVRLTIFNVLGEEMLTLVDGEVEPGYHDVQFTASGLASGVYIYRLTSGAYVVSRTMMLLK